MTSYKQIMGSVPLMDLCPRFVIWTTFWPQIEKKIRHLVRFLNWKHPELSQIRNVDPLQQTETRQKLAKVWNCLQTGRVQDKIRKECNKEEMKSKDKQVRQKTR